MVLFVKLNSVMNVQFWFKRLFNTRIDPAWLSILWWHGQFEDTGNLVHQIVQATSVKNASAVEEALD
jgi:hypothetical protein